MVLKKIYFKRIHRNTHLLIKIFVTCSILQFLIKTNLSSYEVDCKENYKFLHNARCFKFHYRAYDDYQACKTMQWFTIVRHANILTSLVIVICPIENEMKIFIIVYIYIKQLTTFFTMKLWHRNLCYSNFLTRAVWQDKTAYCRITWLSWSLRIWFLKKPNNFPSVQKRKLEKTLNTYKLLLKYLFVS
jgi:hypothetical protein